MTNVYVHCLSYFLSHPHSTTTCPSQLLHYYCYCCWHFLHLLSFYFSTPSTFPHIPNKFKLFTPSTCYVGKLGIKLGIKSLLLLLLLLLLHTLHLLSFHLSNVHTLQLDRHSVTTAAAATTTVAHSAPPFLPPFKRPHSTPLYSSTISCYSIFFLAPLHINLNTTSKRIQETRISK